MCEDRPTSSSQTIQDSQEETEFWKKNYKSVLTSPPSYSYFQVLHENYVLRLFRL